MATSSYALYRCAVLSTSTGLLDNILDRDSPIQILRLTVHTGDQSYADGLDLEPDRFYQWMALNPDTVPTTEPPSAEYLRNTFQYLHKQGYREAIVTTISGKLSASAAIIRQIAAEMADIITIYVVDTGLVCMPEGFFALEALRLLQTGKSAAEVVDYLERLKPHGEIVVGLLSLRQIAISGGFTRAGVTIGNWLNLKPVLRFSNSELTRLKDTFSAGQLLDATVDAVAERIEGRDRRKLVFGGMYGGNVEPLPAVCNQAAQQNRPAPARHSDYAGNGRLYRPGCRRRGDYRAAAGIGAILCCPVSDIHL